MSAFPKADVQNCRVGSGFYVCLWPKADVEAESKPFIFMSAFLPESRHRPLRAALRREDFA